MFNMANDSKYDCMCVMGQMTIPANKYLVTGKMTVSANKYIHSNCACLHWADDSFRLLQSM